MICSLAYIIKLEDINYTKEYDKIIAAQANDPSWVSNLLHMGSPCSKMGCCLLAKPWIVSTRGEWSPKVIQLQIQKQIQVVQKQIQIQQHRPASNKATAFSQNLGLFQIEGSDHRKWYKYYTNKNNRHKYNLKCFSWLIITPCEIWTNLGSYCCWKPGYALNTILVQPWLEFWKQVSKVTAVLLIKFRPLLLSN